LINEGTTGFSRSTLFNVALGIEKVINICTSDRSHEVRIDQNDDYLLNMPVEGPWLLDIVSAQVASLSLLHIFRRDYPNYTRCKKWCLSEL
jgi:hypothetical protein